MSFINRFDWSGPVIVIRVESGSASLSNLIFNGSVLRFEAGASGSSVAVAAQMIAACRNNYSASPKCYCNSKMVLCTTVLEQLHGLSCLCFVVQAMAIPETVVQAG